MRSDTFVADAVNSKAVKSLINFTGTDVDLVLHIALARMTLAPFSELTWVHNFAFLSCQLPRSMDGDVGFEPETDGTTGAVPVLDLTASMRLSQRSSEHTPTSQVSLSSSGHSVER